MQTTMKQEKKSQVIFLFLLLAVSLLLISTNARTTSAATAGFVKSGTKTYYKQSNGTYAKDKLLTINGKTYYFDKNGVMLKGWQYNSSKQKIRYFSTKDGHMCTGYVKDSTGKYRYLSTKTGLIYHGWYRSATGKYRYFDSKEGYMYTGWLKAGGKYRYFNASGWMAVGWVRTKTATWYFTTAKPSSGMGSYGYMYTGLNKIGGKYYYFSSTGQLYKNTVKTINGVKYSIDSNGVATKAASSTSTVVSNHTVLSNGNVQVNENGRTYTLYNAYVSIPGIANGQIDDVTVLAAIADREMGGSTLSGMMGVCMAVLNRSLPENTAFPSNFRQAIFQTPCQFSENAYGSFAAFQRRLNGQGTSAWFNEKVARQAASQALTIYNNYKTKKTPRVISGFNTKDFDYVGFMTPAAFSSNVGSNGFFPGKYETYAGCCTFYDCYNSAWGNK